MKKSKINTIVRNIIFEVSNEFNLGELAVKMIDAFPWSIEFEFTGENIPTKALTVRFNESKNTYSVSRSIHSPSTDLSDTVQQVVVGRIADRILKDNFGHLVMSKEAVVQLWLDAEEENRNGNDEKCLELKDEFSTQFSKLGLDDKQYVNDYLESVGG